MRRAAPRALLAALILSTACGGGDDPAPRPSRDLGSPTPSVSAPASPTAVPSPTPRPTVSSPAPVTGDPMTTTGAFLRLARAAGAVGQGGCEEAYPELLDVACDDATLDGGGVLWVFGTRDAGGGERQWVLRLHTFDPAQGGYVLRYEAVDPSGEWRGFRVLPANLTGFGRDSVVAQVVVDGGRRGYDVLTWRKGGPLTLRAHRDPQPNLRLVIGIERLDEYSAATTAGPYAHRLIRWDGARFRSAPQPDVPAARAPRGS